MARTLRELFTTSSAPEQILTDISRSVQEAVKTKLIGTNFIAHRYGPADIPGTSLNIVHQTKNSYSILTPIAEGVEIPIKTEDTFSSTVKPEKYGIRPLITQEMQEDSLFAVMDRNLKEAGYQFAKFYDRLILNAARRGAANTISGGAAITISNITQGINYLEASDFQATDFIIGPDVAWDLRNIDTFVEANKAGIVNPSDSLIGTIFGMKVWTSNNIYSQPSSTSSNATDAIVLDRSWALTLAEKRPITVERYRDVTRQLDGIVLSARVAAYAIPDTSSHASSAPYSTAAISLITTS